MKENYRLTREKTLEKGLDVLGNEHSKGNSMGMLNNMI